ncbi:MAG: DUF1559 domain-containing protein [Pirellulaceae bacterium]
MTKAPSALSLPLISSLLGCLLLGPGCWRNEAPSVEQQPLKATYITPEFNTVILLRIDRILNSSLALQLKASAGDQYLEELLEQLSLKYNVRLQDANKFTMIATASGDTSDYHADRADIVHYNKQMDVDQVNNQLIGENSKAMLGQQTYFRNQQSQRLSTYWLDQQTVIRAPERHVKQIIPGKSVNRHLAQLVEEAESVSDALVVCTSESIRPAVMLALKATPPDSPYHPFVPALNHLESAVLSIDLTSQRQLRVKLEGHNGSSTAFLVEWSKGILDYSKQLLESKINQLQQAESTTGLATIFQVLRESLDHVSIKLEGNFLVLTTTLSTEQVSRLVEAIGDELRRSAEQRNLTLTRSRLDQIGAAIFRFHQAHGRLPVGDQPPLHYRDGKPLLSWRVHLLPFLREQKLYQQFHLDEPWDSEHNRKLVDQIPHVYTSPRYGKLKGQTSYLAPSGAGTVFGEQEAIGFDDISDGLRQTALVVQVGPDQSVPWTRPADLTSLQGKPSELLGEVGKRLSVLFADGRVFHLSPKIDSQTLHVLFQYQDGKRLDRRQLR